MMFGFSALLGTGSFLVDLSSQLMIQIFEDSYLPALQDHLNMSEDKEDFTIVLSTLDSGQDNFIGFKIYKMNTSNCHESCHGCLEPGRADSCLMCKPGLKKAGGYCREDCGQMFTENCFGKCSPCDYNIQERSLCNRCNLNDGHTC